MTPIFLHYLKVVTAGHISLVFVAGLASTVRGCVRDHVTPVIPVGLILDAGAAGGVPDVPPPPAPKPPKPEPRIPPEPEPRKETVTALSRTGKKPNVDINKPRTKKPPEPARPRITQADIERLKRILGKSNPAPTVGGVGLPNGVPVSDDEIRCLALVRQALYDAWAERPSAEEVGDAVAEVMLRLDRDGRILSKELVKSSGNKNMDNSVLQSIGCVEQIEGLSDTFLGRHDYRVTVAFKLEKQE
jgi:hypothetical protein